MRIRVWGLGFRVLGLGFRVEGFGSRVLGLGFNPWTYIGNIRNCK